MTPIPSFDINTGNIDQFNTVLDKALSSRQTGAINGILYVVLDNTDHPSKLQLTTDQNHAANFGNLSTINTVVDSIIKRLNPENSQQVKTRASQRKIIEIESKISTLFNSRLPINSNLATSSRQSSLPFDLFHRGVAYLSSMWTASTQQLQNVSALFTRQSPVNSDNMEDVGLATPVRKNLKRKPEEPTTNEEMEPSAKRIAASAAVAAVLKPPFSVLLQEIEGKLKNGQYTAYTLREFALAIRDRRADIKIEEFTLVWPIFTELKARIKDVPIWNFILSSHTRNEIS